MYTFSILQRYVKKVIFLEKLIISRNLCKFALEKKNMIIFFLWRSISLNGLQLEYENF